MVVEKNSSRTSVFEILRPACLHATVLHSDAQFVYMSNCIKFLTCDWLIMFALMSS